MGSLVMGCSLLMTGRAGCAPAGVGQFVAHAHHFQLRRPITKTITATQATLSPTPRTRNAGHPFSMLPVSTSKFCPQKPARKEMGQEPRDVDGRPDEAVTSELGRAA